MHSHKTVNPLEIAKFSQHAAQWWDKDGPFKTLHDINPSRLFFIQEVLCAEASMQQKSETVLAGLSILDLGCGGGILSESLAKAGARVVGIDAEPLTIRSAWDHAKKLGLEIEYQAVAVEDHQHEPYDVIVCMELLEHTENPQWIIEHCARLLKPDGYLFLSTLNRSLKAYLAAVLGAEYLLSLLPQQTHDYLKFIKPAELATMTRAAGFHVQRLTGLDYNPFTRKSSLIANVSVNYMMACRKY